MLTSRTQAKLCLGVAILLFGSQALFADTLEIIIRAFIPNSHNEDPAYIFKIKNQSGQDITVLRSPSPIDSDICYVTDQRNFTTNKNVTSRISSGATISFLDGPTKVIASSSDTGTTLAVKCSSGAQFCTDKANTENLKWGSISEAGSLINLPIDGAGSNPCIVPGFIAPNIRYKGQFSLNVLSGQLLFEGDVSKFPSIEAFAIYEKQAPIIIFQEPAIGTVLNIGSLRKVQKSISLPIFEGLWKSGDPLGRFTIEIKGDSYVFTERSTSGASLQRQGKLQIAADGRRIISRENDSDVLKFLDFSPAIIQQVQSLGPKPSLVTFKRSGSKIEATWAGLLVIKDTKGKFKEMKQPGAGPIKTYDFTK